jgi:hypothetical protein
MFFCASFCLIFVFTSIATSISMHVFSFLFFNYYIWPISHNFSLCVYPLIPQHSYIFMFTYCLCVFYFSIISLPSLCILSIVHVHQLCRILLSTSFSWLKIRCVISQSVTGWSLGFYSFVKTRVKTRQNYTKQKFLLNK